jgi:hypothetical protein
MLEPCSIPQFWFVSSQIICRAAENMRPRPSKIKAILHSF